MLGTRKENDYRVTESTNFGMNIGSETSQWTSFFRLGRYRPPITAVGYGTVRHLGKKRVEDSGGKTIKDLVEGKPKVLSEFQVLFLFSSQDPK